MILLRSALPVSMQAKDISHLRALGNSRRILATRERIFDREAIEMITSLRERQQKEATETRFLKY